jgi:2-dehydro-3-deoxygluconokinase
LDVLTFGEAMASLRAVRPLRLGGTLRLSVAGAEANVAIGLARLGHAARWVGLVGEDELGALVLRTLRAEGVDVSHARTEPAGPTGIIVFEPRIAGVTRVSYHRSGSAGSRLAPEDLSAALDEGARVLHVSGVTPALGPDPRAAVAAAVERARRAGATVCLDVNYRSRLWPASQASRALRPLLASVDLLVASPAELEVVAPARAGSTAARVASLLREGVREVVLKHGAGGGEVCSGAGSVRVPAPNVTVVDPVGAGDAFVAGYLSGLLDGEDAERRLRRAVSVAAFAVASEGDWEGLPTRDELPLLDVDPGSTIR